MYTAVIRPTITYAAVVWWPRVNKITAGKKLEHIQRLACLHITSAVRTTLTAALETIIGLTPLPIFVKQHAMIACYRLLINSQWTHTYCGHTVIINLLKKNVPSMQMRSDNILPRYMFDKNFVVSISSKEDWTYHNASFPDDIVCFTDGSRHQLHGCTGASVYNQTENVQEIIPLGKHSTIFQAEVCAILTCVQLLRTQQDQSIVICSDSQAALKALQSPKITSSLVADTVAKLQELSVFNRVRLLWMPGHFGVEGNEMADALAKRAAHSEFLSTEPAVVYRQRQFALKPNYGLPKSILSLGGQYLFVDRLRCFYMVQTDSFQDLF